MVLRRFNLQHVFSIVFIFQIKEILKNFRKLKNNLIHIYMFGSFKKNIYISIIKFNLLIILDFNFFKH